MNDLHLFSGIGGGILGALLCAAVAWQTLYERINEE